MNIRVVWRNMTITSQRQKQIANGLLSVLSRFIVEMFVVQFPIQRACEENGKSLHWTLVQFHIHLPQQSQLVNSCCWRVMLKIWFRSQATQNIYSCTELEKSFRLSLCPTHGGLHKNEYFCLSSGRGEISEAYTLWVSSIMFKARISSMWWFLILSTVPYVLESFEQTDKYISINKLYVWSRKVFALIGIWSFVWLISGGFSINLLIGLLRWLIPNSNIGKIGIDLDSLHWNQTLTFQPMRLVIPWVHYAFGDNESRSDDHELSQTNRLSHPVFNTALNPLPRWNVHYNSSIHEMSLFNDVIRVSFIMSPCSLASDQFLCFCICQNCYWKCNTRL